MVVCVFGLDLGLPCWGDVALSVASIGDGVASAVSELDGRREM